MNLISASDLRSQLASVRLLDARPDSTDYAAGHLPGALHADLNRQLSTASDPGHDPARGGRHPLPSLPRFAAQVGAWGIGPATRIVLYDANGGGNAAARLWWMLRALGHEEVRVLDGGLPKALGAGMPLTSDLAPVTTLGPYPVARWQFPTVDAEEVETLRKDPGRKLLDVRSQERWRGESEPFDPVAGHIPGSLNLPWNENLGPDGCFKSPEALRALYGPLLDGTPPERLAVHCGSGVTACHTLLALDVAGLPGAALYVGSWSEWCRSDRDRDPRP
ncbi:MAG: sulfurtransferase [Geothrix sp.]|uniref:sulfurtransferase n=1 Tax=Geothrix sp. TaxID=1962974 RepID=UPI0017B65B95|nr:sulfurtransferase [Geothrix sp.]NWJ40545.1 sulfurtransferase [Geothrix sp.]WIL21450.1 MAG: sulfurtransferase [Geothrix sp.]